MTRGSCLCGAVGYEITAKPTGVFHCHCSRCRKARGTAHATNMRVELDGFRFVRGEEHLVRYRPPGAAFFAHVFCSTCGSSMPNADPSRGIAVVPMGSLDDSPEPCPAQHIFVGSKADWEESTEGLPRHEAGPPR